jgi:hypothetical protein
LDNIDEVDKFLETQTYEDQIMEEQNLNRAINKVSVVHFLFACGETEYSHVKQTVRELDSLQMGSKESG